MLCGAHRSASRVLHQQIPQVRLRRHAHGATRRQRQPQLLVEVAIVEVALPVHADQVAAHHGGVVGLAEVVAQQLQIAVELAFGNQHGAKTLDGHVGDDEEFVELNAEVRHQFALVVGLELPLLIAENPSLAGRMEVVRLHPLAQVELRQQAAGFLPRLFGAEFGVVATTRMGLALAELVVAGGFPAALMRQPPRRRAWYQAYVQTLAQRDVRDLARIAALDVIPRLLELAAGQTSHLFNVSDLASPFGLSRPTVRDYLTLLERVFLVDVLPPWHVRQINRLVKTPKLHLGDTGVACALLRLDAAALHANRALLGQLLETFVF